MTDFHEEIRKILILFFFVVAEKKCLIWSYDVAQFTSVIVNSDRLERHLYVKLID